MACCRWLLRCPLARSVALASSVSTSTGCDVDRVAVRYEPTAASAADSGTLAGTGGAGDLIETAGAGGATHTVGAAGDGAADAGASVAEGFDTLFRSLLLDLRQQPAERRGSIRYVGFGHRRSAGSMELAEDRAALSLLLNSLSTRASLVMPAAVDAASLIYRIDLSDYGWNREVQLGDVTYRDGWEAIAATSEYALGFVGPDADELQRSANTPLPFMYADALMASAAANDAYTALTELPSSYDRALMRWGIDLQANRLDLQVVRAGVTEGTHIAVNEDLTVERHALPPLGLPLWLSASSFAWGGDSIFDDPFDFEDGEVLAAFSLPNGLFGYAIFDESGQRIARSEGALSLESPVSCWGCHVQGPIRVVDQVRSVVVTNTREFDDGTRAAFQALYPRQPELDALFEREQAAHRAQLTSLGIPSHLGADVITDAIARFQRDVTLADAAAQLGVTSARLLDSLPQLGPELAGLADGSGVLRSDFSRLFSTSLCVLHLEAPGHRPVMADCSSL